MAFPVPPTATFNREIDDAARNQNTDYSLVPGDYFSGTLRNNRDIDYVRLDLQPGEVYRVEVRAGDWFEDPETGGDTSLRLDSYIELGDYDFDGYERIVEYVSPNVYYVRPDEETEIFAVVDSYYGGNRGNGPYAIAVTTPVGEGEEDLPNDTSTTGTIDEDGRYFGSLGAVGDVDWIAVEMSAYRPMHFSVKGEGAFVDPALALYDAEGNLVGQDDDGGYGLDASLVWTVEESGTYYLAVSAGTEGDEGDYSVAVERYQDFAYINPLVSNGVPEPAYETGNLASDYIISPIWPIWPTVDERYGGDDYILGRKRSDTFNGHDGNDTIKGRGGNDWLSGDGGDDELYGNGKRDSLYGGEGDDTMSGGGGRDRLYGNEGNDMLTGDNGRDAFYFGQRDGEDVITDFTLEDDTLYLGRSFHANGRLDSRAVLERYGEVVEDAFILTFKNGETLTLEGITDLDALADVTEMYNDSNGFGAVPYF